MILSEPDTHIEGPEGEVMRAIASVLIPAFVDHGDRATDAAERLTYQVLTRIQARLAERGYVVRHLDHPDTDDA